MPFRPSQSCVSKGRWALPPTFTHQTHLVLPNGSPTVNLNIICNMTAILQISGAILEVGPDFSAQQIDSSRALPNSVRASCVPGTDVSPDNLQQGAKLMLALSRWSIQIEMRLRLNLCPLPAPWVKVYGVAAIVISLLLVIHLQICILMRLCPTGLYDSRRVVSKKPKSWLN